MRLLLYLYVRKKARDTVRLATLKQVSTALELYYTDNGKYPVPPVCGGVGVPTVYYSGAYADSVPQCEWEVLGSVINIENLDDDPLKNSVSVSGDSYYPLDFEDDYGYIYATVDGSNYDLITCLERLENSQTCEKNNFSYYTNGLTGWGHGPTGALICPNCPNPPGTGAKCGIYSYQH